MSDIRKKLKERISYLEQERELFYKKLSTAPIDSPEFLILRAGFQSANIRANELLTFLNLINEK
jgi:hypothetical protein